MGHTDLYDDLCKKCFISAHRMTKKYVDKIVLSEEKRKCDKCGRMSFVVEYVED